MKEWRHLFLIGHCDHIGICYIIKVIRYLNDINLNEYDIVVTVHESNIIGMSITLKSIVIFHLFFVFVQVFFCF